MSIIFVWVTAPIIAPLRLAIPTIKGTRATKQALICLHREDAVGSAAPRIHAGLGNPPFLLASLGPGS